MFTESPPISPGRMGSHDGAGAGDHDVPYRFGHHLTAEAPFPFSTRQLARLLILRGRIQDGVYVLDEVRRLPAA